MATRLQPQRTGVMLAGSGTLLISLDSLGIRLSEAASWDVAFWLGVFGAVAMFVLVPLRSGMSLPAGVRAGGRPIVVSGALQAASLTFFVIAIDLTTVANVVIIIATVPIAAAVIAHFAIGERTSGQTWLAIAVAMVGVVVLVSNSIDRGRIEGDLFAVAAILSFATNLTVWRRHPGLDRKVIIGLGGLLAALVAFIPAAPFGLAGRALAILAALGLVTGPIGRVALATATRYLPAARVGLFAPVETVAAITWAWLFLDESPDAATIVGGAIVIAAVLYGSLAAPPAPRPRSVA